MARFVKAGGKKGFTLVELLAVMAIISILAGLLLPAISRARIRAREMACKSNLRQIGIAISLYTQDFGGWMIVDGDWNDDLAGTMGTDLLWDGKTIYDDTTHDHLAGLGLLTMLENKYIGNPDVLFCPSDDYIKPGKELDALKRKLDNTLGYGSYIYRQLDGRRVEDAQKGRLGSLGKNPGVGQDLESPPDKADDTDVKVIAADRNFLGFRPPGGPNDTIVRTNHDGSSMNLLYEDGHVETVLNQNPDKPLDLRLNMLSGAPPTFTDGSLEQEYNRVWVLYDEAR